MFGVAVTVRRAVFRPTRRRLVNWGSAHYGDVRNGHANEINSRPVFIEKELDQRSYPALLNADKAALDKAADQMEASAQLLEVVKPGPALFVTDPLMSLHRPEDLMPGHPDSVNRLDAIYAAVRANIDNLPGLEFAHPADIPRLQLKDLLRVHDEDLVRTILQWDGATRKVDNDLAITPHSVRAALRACDCVAHAIDSVTAPPTSTPSLPEGRESATIAEGSETATPKAGAASTSSSGSGRPWYETCGTVAPDGNPFAGTPIRRAFCAVRPSGHHCERDRAMGMGMFNSVAVGVAKAMASGRVKKPLIVDLDLFHGNGFVDIFGADPRVVCASVHVQPHYPYSGFFDQGGKGAAAGNVVNMQVDTDAGVREWFACLSTILPLVLEQHEADLIVVPFSFTHHIDDPLSPAQFNDGDFVTLASAAMQLASSNVARDVPIVFVLEGGFSPDVLARCVPLTLRTILGQQQPAPMRVNVDRYTESMLTALLQHHQHHWIPMRKKVLYETATSTAQFEEYLNYKPNQAPTTTPEYSNHETVWDTRPRPIENLEGIVRRHKVARDLTEPNIMPTLGEVSAASRHVDAPSKHGAPAVRTVLYPFASPQDPSLASAFKQVNEQMEKEKQRYRFKTEGERAAAERLAADVAAGATSKTGPGAYVGSPRGTELNTNFQE